jgi:hypothetical protein
VRFRGRRGRTYKAACSGAGIAAAVVAATLALSGCSSDSGSEAKKQQPTPSATATVRPSTPVATTSDTPSASSSASASDSTGTGGASTDSTQTVEGVWLAMESGNKVQLVLGKGKAGLTSTHLCGGAYTGKDGISITLTCMDGDKERTSGHGVMAADGKTLTVRWSDGITDTFSRTGLPSS